jgi:hypothetical protein
MFSDLGHESGAIKMLLLLFLNARLSSLLLTVLKFCHFVVQRVCDSLVRLIAFALPFHFARV